MARQRPGGEKKEQKFILAASLPREGGGAEPGRHLAAEHRVEFGHRRIKAENGLKHGEESGETPPLLANRWESLKNKAV